MNEEQAEFYLMGPDVDTDHVIVNRDGLTVGRTSNNNLVLRDKQISRQHMRIVWRDGNFWVEDLKSRNGVFLNDSRIDPHLPKPLARGDVVRVGPFVLRLDNLIRPSAADPHNGGNLPPDNSIEPFQETISRRAGMIESSPAAVYRSSATHAGLTALQLEALVPRVLPRADRYPQGIAGIPEDRSTWMKYLPGIYSDPALDPTEFLGRYLLIFESLMNPIIWIIDNFDLYLSPETAPENWLQWMGAWFDVQLLEYIPLERQREIMRQVGWLFLRRGTRAGLERLLRLYFGVEVQILEDSRQPCHFVVRMPLSQSDVNGGEELALEIIESQSPAFTTFDLEVS